jgi:hypothetical protein
MEGNPVPFTKGFFHVQRDAAITTARGFYQEALDKISSMQCKQSSSGDDPERPADGDGAVPEGSSSRPLLAAAAAAAAAHLMTRRTDDSTT